ncbi:MAG TPA: bifunctional response regulator/alkaline phosphatase family protein [Candidatus Marinimicrobia bacterium]|jgi:CheY-like chemotaxis protein|nr:bifunctional response regulator/alkaline phosphatase family protein [Candidatus Neomarinimicrobiota bacterium]MDP7217744.1 bifunctional response regulator/alkaline phosphatase family protein [Candidatus Neomarinimicrobiota bacterium]MDP7436627.1 bifunctional response regulator/alkaline phosphatase family protein [Candidatus Neomarinimicrobiota bacterium]HBN45676.1 PglZ domain-containing protein [Candidatus Neomarinimicrobiota bacterium]HJL75589.1 bifunctional response regulator/alkaline phos|tara:strand:- start:2220 stop:3776 length:1557 start_codon:yes stop_codon:yes gene_type:complete
MTENRGNILWVDDEVDHLKPHILFLEEKGYHMSKTTNGQDAVAMVGQETYDLVLLDQFMPGKDGMTTLREIKEIKPALPVILITKSEEEDLMDEAISEKVAQFLIKPVNPTQIFMACKQVLEQSKIREEHATSGYLQEFQEIQFRLQEDMSADDWWDVYTRLVKWQLEFDDHPDISLGDILAEQLQSANNEFVKFIEQNYKDWLFAEDRPALSNDVFSRFVLPEIEQQKTCLVVIDALRYDQFMSIADFLNPYYDIKFDYQFSLLPTATPFSRNAIFSGLFPDEFVKKFPDQFHDMENHAKSLNQHEEKMLRSALDKTGFKDKTLHYEKINTAEQGKKFQSYYSDIKNTDVLGLVANFVDMLAHKRAESDVLREMLPDESGYRSAIRTWFEHSWLFALLRDLSQDGFTVIMTSDHGSTQVHKGVLVGADKETSKGVRYKIGRNLNTNEKHAIIIRRPADYRLVDLMHQTTYLIAKEDVFFLYPNQQHKYEGRLKDSFQHGGISLEEMMVPVVTLRSKS